MEQGATKYHILTREGVTDPWVPAVAEVFDLFAHAFEEAKNLCRSKRGRQYMIAGMGADEEGDPIDLQMFVRRAIDAQESYCRDRGVPHFAPASGICYSCRRQIYGPNGHDGTSHVTHCRRCNYSFCD